MGYTYVRTVLMVEGRRDPATHAKYVRTYVSTYVRTYVDMGGGRTFPSLPPSSYWLQFEQQIRF